MSSPIHKKPKTGWTIILAGVLTFGGGWFSAGLAQNPDATKEAWVVPERAARKQNPIAADESSILKGRELYVSGCLPCHGPAGRGDGPAGAILERNGVAIHPGNLSDPKMWQQTDGAIFWKITEGKSPMPTWRETLTEEQRWQVVNYVRTLAPKTGSDVGITNNVDKVASTNKIATTNPGSKP